MSPSAVLPLHSAHWKWKCNQKNDSRIWLCRTQQREMFSGEHWPHREGVWAGTDTVPSGSSIQSMSFALISTGSERGMSSPSGVECLVIPCSHISAPAFFQPLVNDILRDMLDVFRTMFKYFFQIEEEHAVRVCWVLLPCSSTTCVLKLRSVLGFIISPA